ncbi:hypothetical protein MKX01_014547 [Papaver californicum]|nr:hypothetical protein MKX01_014547 [Papaver californicum]
MEGRGGGGGEEENVNAPLVNIQVKFSGRSIPVSLSIESTVKDLKSLLQSLTNVLPRGQKLIFKGKVLEDNMKLKSTDITNGSKLMLMASQGLHQGDGPIRKQVVSSGSGLRKPNVDGGNAQGLMDCKVEAASVVVDKSRSKHWKITGVVALSGVQLKVIPEEVWGCGSSIRVLDIGRNSIHEVPAKIGSLSSIQVDLASNLLVDLPETIGSLRNLKALHLSNSGLNSLPSTLFKLCTQLSTLDLHNTEITIDVLRQFEGWEAFDKRRRLKHQKQLDFRVGSSGVFDEGADKN